MSGDGSEVFTQEKILEHGSNVSASERAMQNEKTEQILSQDDKRQRSESSSNEQEDDQMSSGHPSNVEHSSEGITTDVPTDCSESVSLEPEPGSEELNKNNGPVRFFKISYLFCSCSIQSCVIVRTVMHSP